MVWSNNVSLKWNGFCVLLFYLNMKGKERISGFAFELLGGRKLRNYLPGGAFIFLVECNMCTTRPQLSAFCSFGGAFNSEDEAFRTKSGQCRTFDHFDI